MPPNSRNGSQDDARRRIRPLDPPMTPFAVAGMAVWAVAGLVLLGFRSTLVNEGREDWLWICLAGVLLGLPGLFVMRRHDANRRRRATTEAHAGATTDPQDPLHQEPGRLQQRRS